MKAAIYARVSDGRYEDPLFGPQLTEPREFFYYGELTAKLDCLPESTLWLLWWAKYGRW